MALGKARALYEQMTIQGWHGSQITYHAMIKAFAMHGDTAACFKLLDEMAAKRHAVTIDTYTHLLMACVGDKRMGFVLAVRVMRLILWNRMKPSVVCYDNLLRAAKECGCGDNTEVLNKLLNDAKQTQLKDPKVLQIAAGDNLLDTRLDEGLISVSAVPKDVGDRLALIGGIEGVLKQMSFFGLKPTSKTCSILLGCITKEEDLLATLKLIPLDKMDIGFWNQLLKKSVVEKFECAHYIEKKLYKSGLEFDILTYGILAMRVDSAEGVERFMRRLDAKEIVPNEVIMSTLINNISRKFKYSCLLKLLHYCRDNNIPLNRHATRNLANTLNINEHAEKNVFIQNALKSLQVTNDEMVSRVEQFNPAVYKRNKRRWDPDANDEDIEERDRELEKEAEQTKAEVAKYFLSKQQKRVPTNQ